MDSSQISSGTVCDGESCLGVDQTVVAINNEAQCFLDLARSIHGRGRSLSPIGLALLRSGLAERYGERLGNHHPRLVDQLTSLAVHGPKAA